MNESRIENGEMGESSNVITEVKNEETNEKNYSNSTTTQKEESNESTAAINKEKPAVDKEKEESNKSTTINKEEEPLEVDQEKEKSPKKESNESTTTNKNNEELANKVEKEFNDSATMEIDGEKPVPVDTADNETEKNKNKNLDKIGERLRFFFSNVNLRSDRFMRETMKHHEESIPLEILLRFNSIRQYTNDPNDLTLAVKELCSDFLSMDKDEKGVKRIEAFDMMSNRGENAKLSLVIDNLPISKTGMFYDVSVQDVIEQFSEYGKVTLVRFRYVKAWKRREEKNAIGSAFVEFQTREELLRASKDLIGEKEDDVANRTVVLKGNEIKIQTMDDWLMKIEQEKKYNSNRNEADSVDKTNDIDTAPPKYETGGVIAIKGLPEECSREKIFSAIEDYSRVWTEDENVDEEQKDEKGKKKKRLFIDYSRGQSNGALRFTNESIILHRETIAEIAIKFKQGELLVDEQPVEDAYVLEGTEEKNYWNEYYEFFKKRRLHQKRKFNNRGGKSYNKRRRT